VIYIEGFGRSGTTLLDAALGQIDGFFSLGEAAFLWDRALRPGEICGCGVAAVRCPIWGEVLAGLAGGQVAAGELAHWRSHAFRVRESPLTARGVLEKRIRARSGKYLDVLAASYRKLVQVSGAQVLVDSSKSPSYGYLLRLVPGVAVHTVHVVRDPRAVAFSWQRDRAGEGLPARAVRTTARGWAVEEILAEVLRAGRVGGRTVVRYEDLVADPARAIRSVLHDLGEDDRSIEFARPGSLRLGQNHIVSGNPSRFRRGIVGLTLDAEWETVMSRRDMTAVTATCLPWIARYGYPIRKTRGLEHVGAGLGAGR
jgi:hypothetical protein